MMGDTILLVDVDPETEEKMVFTLEAEGYLVFTSEGSKVTVEMANKFRPAVIFLRPLSPSATGFAACRTIHNIETLREVPIVILASLRGPIDPRFTAYYGIVDFLKPVFTPEELKEKTSALVGRRQDEESPLSSEQAVSLEEEDRTEQVTSYSPEETVQEEEVVQTAPSEEKNEVKRFKEEWHSEDNEKVLGADRSIGDDKKYTAPTYKRMKSNKSSSKKGLFIIVMALVVIVAAGFVLYLGYVFPDKRVRGTSPSLEPQKQQDTAGIKQDAPSPQPSSSPPLPGQAPELSAQLPEKTFYAAQIGAFKTEGAAESLAQKFKDRGYEAYVQQGTAKDSSLVYRVLIGRFEKRKEAMTLAGAVGAKEKIKTTVFQGE